MKKVKGILIIFFATYIYVCTLINPIKANADEYNEAVVGHVITQVLQGTDIEAAAVMEAQLERILYNMITEFSGVLQEHLPNILDSLASEIRQKNDKEFKCALLKNSQYECN